jgi:hypothetical protein
LIAQQARIYALEEELDLFNAKLSTRKADDVDNGSTRKDNPERIQLIDTISDALVIYGMLQSWHSEHSLNNRS